MTFSYEVGQSSLQTGTAITSNFHRLPQQETQLNRSLTARADILPRPGVCGARESLTRTHLLPPRKEIHILCGGSRSLTTTIASGDA